ncbi:MAG: hypothetical protein ACOY0R_20860 [Chloroflexota bacterium]
MSSRLHLRRMAAVAVAVFLFVLACSISVSPPVSGDAPPAYDATKAVLELQSTAMSLQLTQAAFNNQPASTLPPPPAPTQAPSTAVPPPTQPLPTSTQDFMARMKTAKILVYENTDERNIGLWIRDALDGLGLTYTHTGSYSGHFMEYLNSGTKWDLIIVGAEDKDKISGEFWDVIDSRLARDKTALIVEIWYLDREANGPIAKILSRCGIRYQKDYDLANSIYWWKSDHPVFNEPNVVLPLLHYNRFWASQAGDQIRLGSGGDATLLAGLSSHPQSQEAVLATCEQGRIIFQTFSDHDYDRGEIVPLWENYIYYTLKNHFAVVP